MSRRTISPISTNSRYRRISARRRRGSPARQCPGELANRLLMLLVPDLGKIAGDLEQHPLVRGDLTRAFLPDAFVKVGDRRAQRAGYLEQSSSRNAIDAALILVSLLIGNSDHFSELLLGQAQHDTALANPS